MMLWREIYNLHVCAYIYIYTHTPHPFCVHEYLRLVLSSGADLTLFVQDDKREGT